MLVVRIKPRAVREIHQAALWWSLNRPSAPGAIESDVVAAMAALVEQPGIGRKVENARDAETRRVYLARVGYCSVLPAQGQVPGRRCVLAFVSGARAWHLTRGTTTIAAPLSPRSKPIAGVGIT